MPSVDKGGIRLEARFIQWDFNELKTQFSFDGKCFTLKEEKKKRSK